jgi:NADP-dependent 3-hydroxy acid dehydrogenase YdfG
LVETSGVVERERPVVVVTAADTDDGAAHARALAGAARAVVLCGRDGARLGTLAAELRTTTRVAVFQDDVAASPAAVAEMVAEIFVTDARAGDNT